MPDGKRHCAIVLTTDLLVQLSGCFCGIWGLLPKGKRHRAVALTHIKLRDLLLPLCCRRTVRGGVFLCHPALGAAQRHLRAIRPTNQLLPHLGKYLLTYLLTYLATIWHVFPPACPPCCTSTSLFPRHHSAQHVDVTDGSSRRGAA